jgi:hypothetical protein
MSGHLLHLGHAFLLERPVADRQHLIDQQDFRLEDDDDYFGLAPGKTVGLKYAFVIRCDSYETDEAGKRDILFSFSCLFFF